ncbi:MAG: phosphodiester glycosidase family protein [Legionellaceae bacterium]|nr:phosphodiester glycosidase family protein [Legionellaceae bacterium]
MRRALEKTSNYSLRSKERPYLAQVERKRFRKMLIPAFAGTGASPCMLRFFETVFVQPALKSDRSPSVNSTLRAVTKTIKISLIIVLHILAVPAMADQWMKLAPGIEYQDLSSHTLTPWSHIHAFRVDLKSNKLSLVMAGALSHEPAASANAFAHHSNALIALNGGFFDHDFHPLGLRISNQHQHNPLKYISWWGIFYIKNQKAHVSSVRDFTPDRGIDFAVQTGPRLLIHGQIPSLKPGFAERSALGITARGQVIILVTENSPMSTAWLAETMKSPPLNCTDALNLDGGSSSQLYAHIGIFKINVPNFASVSDAIIVKPI